ncbi:hypothetical protein KHA80_05775 [Anaerobacillus sp. HL2]|nr:hypothetical protein KHA80_05775 [Anaerobacillus sp. HL2]
MKDTSIQQYLIDFVTENETFVVEDWYKRVLHDMHDINKDKIRKRYVNVSVSETISD